MGLKNENYQGVLKPLIDNFRYNGVTSMNSSMYFLKHDWWNDYTFEFGIMDPNAYKE